VKVGRGSRRVARGFAGPSPLRPLMYRQCRLALGRITKRAVLFTREVCWKQTLLWPDKALDGCYMGAPRRTDTKGALS